MMQQAEDFREECNALADLLKGGSTDLLARVTQFKDWTVEDILGHLHMFNFAARVTLEDGGKFDRFYHPVAECLEQGKSMLAAQEIWLNGLKGEALYVAWRRECDTVVDLYAKADPKMRLNWAGPSMSARSSITARQMETWAHGQAIFDLLGVERQDADRIKNIAHLGVNTYGWTFINRKESVPEPAPFVRLTAPSGEIWEWNEPRDENRVEGDATAFCQVVTQTRNIADTDLKVSGDGAMRWMELAQCFAGQPNSPPQPGSRYVQKVP